MIILKNLYRKTVPYSSYIFVSLLVLMPFVYYFYMQFGSKTDSNQTYNISAETIKISPRSQNDPKLVIIPETVKVKPMDPSIIITLLTTISLIAAYIFNPVVNRKLKLISSKIDKIDGENKIDHETVIRRLTDIETITNRYVEKVNLQTRLTDINIDAMKYSNDPTLSQYLNHDFDNYLNLVKYIDSVGVTNINSSDLCIKIKNVIDNNQDAAERYLGSEFTSVFFNKYRQNLISFRERVISIKEDIALNNKDLRFKTFAQTFLHDHISFIMNNHYKFKTDD